MYFVCQPACLLPAIRPINSKRIGSVVSHNTEYGRANTDLLFWLRFIQCAMVSPFILHCFLSLWLENEKVRNHRRGINELYDLSLLRLTNCQMYVYLIASSVKVIKCSVFAMYQFKSARMAYHVLGPWFAYTVATKNRELGRSFLSCTDSHHQPRNM